MRLHIDQILPEGLLVELDMDCTWAVQAVARSLDGEVRELDGSVRVRLMGTGATVQGHAGVLVDQRCDRCLTPLRLRIEGEVDLYFESERLEGDANVGLQPDDLDMGFLEEGLLDLGAALGEFFLLEVPPRLRCEDPGVTRVEPGACQLATAPLEGEPQVDPRFAALENFSAD